MKIKNVLIFISLFLGIIANGDGYAQGPLTTIAMPGRATGVCVAGAYVHAVDNLSLQIFTIADPANPTSFDSRSLPSFALKVAGTGAGDAYVADGYNGLRIFRASPENSPNWNESAVEIENFATGVAIGAGIVCVTSSGYFFNDGGFHVVRDGMVAGSVRLPENASGVALAGNYAFVADGPGGMVAINITDPEVPEIAGTANIGGDIADVAADGMRVFAADRVNGLISIDVSDPANPQIMDSIYAPGAAAVTVVGDKALVAAGSAGVHVVNVANPAVPFLMASVPVPGSAADVDATAHMIYVADEIAGLVVLAMPPDQYPYIRSVSPPQVLNGETAAIIRAEVRPEGGVSINRVWMEIIPPDSPDPPTTVDMADPDNDAVYEGNHSFEPNGTYTITVQAMDDQGGRSVPMSTTVTQNGSVDSGGGGGSGCFVDTVFGNRQ